MIIRLFVEIAIKSTDPNGVVPAQNIFQFDPKSLRSASIFIFLLSDTNDQEYCVDS